MATGAPRILAPLPFPAPHHPLTDPSPPGKQGERGGSERGREGDARPAAGVSRARPRHRRSKPGTARRVASAPAGPMAPRPPPGRCAFCADVAPREPRLRPPGSPRAPRLGRPAPRRAAAGSLQPSPGSWGSISPSAQSNPPRPKSPPLPSPEESQSRMSLLELLTPRSRRQAPGRVQSEALLSAPSPGPSRPRTLAPRAPSA